MSAYATLTSAGVSTREASALTGIARASMDRAAAAARTAPAARTAAAAPDPAIAAQATSSPGATSQGSTSRSRGAQRRPAPQNKITADEERVILEVLHSNEFIDSTPTQVYATLLGRGEYLCSISSMYRILRRHDEVRDRRRQARHPSRARPELTARSPGQVYTWDITKLPGPGKGCWYDAYVMIDIYSRMIVGVRVYSHESAPLAADMVRETFGVHGIPQVVHADRGTSMTSKTVADLLEDLGVTRSHSRPRVSNDNPYSESWFKTAKYSSTFPDRFPTLAEARSWMIGFSDWYNHEHHHTGIGLHTPADVHHHRAGEVGQVRSAALRQARQDHPERFASGSGEPKALDLPDTAWINRPEDQQAEATSAA